jgi:hypothetical protein
MKAYRMFAGVLIAGALAVPAAMAETATAATDKPVEPIQYHGGPILTGVTHIYYLWYGDWAESPVKPVLTDFASTLGGSAYYNINSTHPDASGKRVHKSILLSGSANDNYSQGNRLADADVLKALRAAIRRDALPKDPNGIYFIFTAADVEETSGFCSDYCSWHKHAKIAGVDIKYAFVGNPSKCASVCELAPGNSPNGDATADAMVATVAARINETVTNPDANGWYDAAGLENTEKCLRSADPFGTTFTTADGAKANLRLGSRNYLVPENWVNAKSGYCAMQYP